MYTAFQALSDKANIWVYQANNQLTTTEVDEILEEIQPFLAAWSTYGVPLIARAEIRYNYFLIFGIESSAFKLSCCTIDEAIYWLKTIGEARKVNFLDRTKVLLQVANQLLLAPTTEIKAKLREGFISSDTKIFNNAITQKKELETNWLIPIQLSWLVK